MSHRPLHARRRLGFESLEHRALPAGNVTAAVVAGNLQIAGDSSNNAIIIGQIDADSFWVSGSRLGTAVVNSLTPVNGSTTPQRFDGVTGDILMDMLAGNDYVQILPGTLPRDLIGTFGIGNDKLVLRDVTIARDLSVDMGGGADIFSLGSSRVTVSSFVQNSFTLLGGTGNDTLGVGYTGVQHNLSIDGGADNDAITVVRCVVVDSILVNAGSENDSVTIQSNLATGVVVALGDGVNSASILGGTYGNVTVTGGINEDTVTCDLVAVVGDITISTAERADTVKLNRSKADRFVVDVGDNQRTVGNVVTVTRCAGNHGIFTCTGLRLNSLTIDKLSQIEAITWSGFQIVNM